MTFDCPTFYRDLRDYVVADVNNLAAAEETTLRKVAAPLTFPLTQEDEDDIADLIWKFDSERDGIVGISAPMVGLSKRILVIRIAENIAKLKSCQGFDKTAWINPKFYSLSNEMEESWEQCASVKDCVGPVKRYKSIIYLGFHEDGRPIRGRADGFAARVIQHEIDHLNGKLFIDYVPKEKLLTNAEYMKKFHGPDREWAIPYRFGPNVSTVEPDI